MRKTEIRVERPEAFFERGRRYARLGDQGRRVPRSAVIAFDDAESLLRLLSEQRVVLWREVRDRPGSIAALARRLKRDRSAITRDVQMLERFGVVRVAEKPFPGHGRQKWITPVARALQLTAQL